MIFLAVLLVMRAERVLVLVTEKPASISSVLMLMFFVFLVAGVAKLVLAGLDFLGET